MKFIVDSLPYFEGICPFEDKCPYGDSKNDTCPKYWDKYDVDVHEHECFWLKEDKEQEDD